MKFNYEKLFYEIKRKGIKQKYIAEQIGISERYLSEIKRREREMTGTQLAIICSILASPFDMFVTKDES